MRYKILLEIKTGCYNATFYKYRCVCYIHTIYLFSLTLEEYSLRFWECIAMFGKCALLRNMFTCGVSCAFGVCYCKRNGGYVVIWEYHMMARERENRERSGNKVAVFVSSFAWNLKHELSARHIRSTCTIKFFTVLLHAEKDLNQTIKKFESWQ